MQAGRVEIEISARDTNFPKTAATIQRSAKGIETALGGVDDQARTTGLSIGGLAKAAAGLFVFGKVSSLLKDSVKAAGEAAEASARVTAAIKSTGGAAGLALGELEAMASGLQKVTTFEDDAILSSQALLLTFTKIGKSVFPRATETMLNMSAALGQDLKSSAIQLGKALNDPVEGISALGRVGVQLTKDQEALIKAFVRVGDTESAQKVILRELEVQMGGTARAVALAGAGPLKQFANIIGDIKEDLGNALLPVLVETTKKVSAFVVAAKESGKLEQVFRSFAGAVQWTVENVDKLAIVGSGLLAVFAVEKLVAVATAVKGIGLAIAAVTAANPVMLAIGVAATAAGVAFVAARDSAKAFNDEAQNIEAAEKQLAKYESVAQKVAAMHQKMQENNPFGDDSWAPKGAKRLPDAPPEKKAKNPLTDEQIKAAAEQKKILQAMAEFEAAEDFKREKRKVESARVADQVAARNAQAEIEYIKGKTEVEKQIQTAGLQGFEAQMAENKSHYDNLRKQAAEFLIDEQELSDAKVRITEAETAQRRALYLSLAQSQSATLAGNLQNVASAWKSFAGFYKKAAQLQNAVDTYAGATAAYKSLAGIPIVGPALGAAAAAAAVAGGIARGAMIERQKFANGGIVPGTSTSGDRVPAMVNSGEMILNRRQQANLFALANGRGESRGGGVSIGDIVINLPAGASEEDGRRAGKAASDTILSRLRGHVRDSQQAEYLGVRA